MEEVAFRRDMELYFASSLYKKAGNFHLVKEVLTEEGIQGVHTPESICKEMLAKINEYQSLDKANILVMFNAEFVDVLLRVFRINSNNITFIADSELEKIAVQRLYGVSCSEQIISWNKETKKVVMPVIKKQFDVVVMNPPYQPPTKESEGGSGSRHVLWPEFVKLAIKITKDNGYIAAIHPAKWRKPEDEMLPLMKEQNILYLEMHSKQDGIKTFGAMTPYDWYVMQKSAYQGKTVIKCIDEVKEEIDLRKFDFLPSSNLVMVSKLLAKAGQERCKILFSRSEYGSDKPWMSEKQVAEFKHPCVHTTNKGGVRFWYSSKKEEFFGIPKLIFGEADIIASAVIDIDGSYGITQQSMAIPISSREEGEAMKKALESKEFNDLLQNSLRWSQFRIDWRMFRSFRKDFWKNFI